MINVYKTKLPRIKGRSSKTEKEIADLRLGEFNIEESVGMKFIKSITDKEITRQALVSLATIFSILSGIVVNRDLKRRRELLIKWFDINAEKLEPFKEFVSIM
ncbi:hypothetical protein TRFO_09685 [Tritrichomonas foetus]|uniref:Uncharacterized protein n=1 Tax=Tritrichomonas foetus TaxID=1144522 RepID=A0A1J4JDD9_9EUKA|nr:hypothetical protein TRFO_09685 [Tritrichomonas foetus]|eukprot:OHS97112.1 hypothetical protein TRFO_09685 [Tritrichomonas foetus]